MRVIFESSLVRSLFLTLLVGSGLMSLAACGQKGPLVLPAPQPAASSASPGTK